MHFERTILNVASPDSLAKFYIDRLGMAVHTEDENQILSFPGQGASLELRKSRDTGRYTHQPGDRYWKIGITLPNVDVAHGQLHDAGVQVSEPHQFGDIGYMCHLSDPDGFSIELLQHHFETNRPSGLGDTDQRLGGGAQIGQVTLRCTDIASTLAFYHDQMGMTLLSVQPVNTYGFTLYFLAFTDEVPPNSDLKAVVNREWLWQRPYTTLEIQHLEKPGAVVQPSDEERVGFGGLVLSGADRPEYRHDEAGSSVYIQA